jgi:hypothetical protein
METSTATSQPGLDAARHLADQLPPGFPRGDEATMDAVMQLAAFTEQQHQQHHPHENVVEHHLNDVGQSPGDKPGRKRKGEGTGKSASAKMQKAEEHHDPAAHQHWHSFTGQEANEFEQLLQHSEGQVQGNDESQQSMNDSMQECVSTSDAELLTRHGRPLSTTKRAAQNRAAQRAFRERRDQHVKEVEIKAKQVDQAMAQAAMHKARYDELIKTIAELRADNSSLRVAISALGGSVPPPPPAVSYPNLDMSQDLDPSAYSYNNDGQHTTDEKVDNHLDGLSAVAAAAAAAATAAAHADQDNEFDKDESKNDKVQQ